MKILFKLIIHLICIIQILCEDYYKILGLKRNANKIEIKKAYKKLTLLHHPDKNQGDKKSAELFSKINVAYEVLSDPEKRRIYDQHGEKGLSDHLAQQSQGSQGGFGDIFSQFFGQQAQQQNKAQELFLKIRVTLEEIYNGKDVPIFITKQQICPHCRGTGADNIDDVKTCPACNGKGHVIKRQEIAPGFIQQFQGQCDQCKGKGKTYKTKCHVCEGQKVIDGLDTISLFIERGIADKQMITFPNGGDEHVDKAAADIIFQIIQIPHKTFTRQKNDLHTKVNLTLEEALLGFKKVLIHLDGRKIKLEQNSVTQPGYVQKMPKEGMPHHQDSSNKGDLYIQYNVDIPQSFTNEQLNLWKKFFEKTS